MSTTCKTNSSLCTTQCEVRLAPNHALHVTSIIGASLSEPHINGLHMRDDMYVCMYVFMYGTSAYVPRSAAQYILYSGRMARYGVDNF